MSCLPLEYVAMKLTADVARMLFAEESSGILFILVLKSKSKEYCKHEAIHLRCLQIINLKFPFHPHKKTIHSVVCLFFQNNERQNHPSPPR